MFAERELRIVRQVRPAQDGPIIWFNVRQEPDVYVNGSPVCARPPSKIGEYAELGAVTRDSVKKSEVEFLEACKQRCRDNT